MNKKNLMRKAEREMREFDTIFRNPKNARSAWNQTVYDRYCKPAFVPIPIYDKDGNLTQDYQLQKAIYDALLQELRDEGLDRMPTDGEMMEACHAYTSRTNSTGYTARRDSMGAKPIDESKQIHTIENPLEGLSDEELMAMQMALETHRLEAASHENNSEKHSNEQGEED